MELLTVVLTILADGGFVLRCRAKAGNMEIYLEGVEAVGFLRGKSHTLSTKKEAKRNSGVRGESTNGGVTSGTLALAPVPG